MTLPGNVGVKIIEGRVNRTVQLAAQGVIKRRLAFLAPAKAGFQMTVFASIQMGKHSDRANARFAAGAASMKETMNFYCLAGYADYGLRAVAADAAAFDAFYKRLIGLMPLKSVLSRLPLMSSNPRPPFRYGGKAASLTRLIGIADSFCFVSSNASRHRFCLRLE
ncbi:MAG TPA: Lrp/AsnC ligand binding domain-containing protein [Methylocella sp.]|nr:Lrp/AsnC ligand binding domain-containing protein [Methylocella sp.]